MGTVAGLSWWVAMIFLVLCVGSLVLAWRRALASRTLPLFSRAMTDAMTTEVVARDGAGPSLSMGWILRAILMALLVLVALPFGQAARPVPAKRSVGATPMASSVMVG